MTRLSEALWDTYVNPASAVTDPQDADQERWRRERQREAFDDVVDGIRSPNLPDESGMMITSYNPVEGSAHHLGRTLHEINDPPLTNTVADDAQLEIDAVRAAERGDLTGRAAQAVELDRVDASPVQVDAADELLRANPLGSAGLFTALDPAAACVAAAHWLVAAATVAGDADDREPWEVFAEADTIEACSIEVPALIVEAIVADDRAPRDIVLGLLAAAALVRQGRVPDPDVVAEQVSDAYRQAEQAPPEQRDGMLRALLPPRSTLLDPLRPSRDLLEHLLDGIQASLVLYREVAADDSVDDGASLGTDTDTANRDMVQDDFVAEVRAVAAETHPRLT